MVRLQMNSKVNPLDIILEALSSISAQKLRTLLTMLGTILGVGSFVAIMGLGATANGQIARGFNELQATHITVTDIATKNGTKPDYNFPPDAVQRVQKLNGVKNAGVYFNLGFNTAGADKKVGIGKLPAVSNSQDLSSILSVFGADAGALDAAGAKLISGVNLNQAYSNIQAQVVVLGSVAASKLGITSISLRPTVFIDNRSFTVVGILDEIHDNLPQLNNALIMPIQTALNLYGKPTNLNPAVMLVQTDLGASKLISIQAPFALRPDKPEALLASSPPDWSVATAGASSSVDSLLLLLSVVALIIGGVAITNTTLVSILERRGEIGLRLALGAKQIHICVQFLLESVFLGVIGATLGNALGLLAVLGGSIYNQWTPVIDPFWLLLAPLLGVLIGILAGLYPAYRTGKITPVEALGSGV
jgi:putative ABC transport system permease protein